MKSDPYSFFVWMKRYPHLPPEEQFIDERMSDMSGNRLEVADYCALAFFGNQSPLTGYLVHIESRTWRKLFRIKGLLECISGLLPHNLIQMWQNRQL
jgi:hypothetical protein